MDQWRGRSKALVEGATRINKIVEQTGNDGGKEGLLSFESEEEVLKIRVTLIPRRIEIL